jgi:catechol 2,3-dioxygenase-like lactoylglutathione lyase family enzyme
MTAMRSWLLLPISLLAAAAAFLLPAQTPGPNGSGVAFGHIHLMTPDPDKTEKLIVDILGGTPTRISALQTVKMPGVFFILGKREGGGGSDGSAINHVGFYVKSYAATKAKATAAGLAIRELVPNVQAFITFPGDVLVEIQEMDTVKGDTAEFSHYHLSAPNTEEARQWYLKTFGAADAERRKGNKGAGLPGGTIDFLAYGSPTKAAPAPLAATKGRSLDHIGFEVTNLKAFTEKLAAQGVAFDRPYSEMKAKIGVDLAFINDPNGTYIELTEGLAGH